MLFASSNGDESYTLTECHSCRLPFPPNDPPQALHQASCPSRNRSVPRSPPGLQAVTDRRDGQVEMQCVIEQRHESVPLVEGPRRLVDRVHLDGEDADVSASARQRRRASTSSASPSPCPWTAWSTARRASRTTGTVCLGSLRAEDSGRCSKDTAPEARV